MILRFPLLPQTPGFGNSTVLARQFQLLADRLGVAEDAGALGGQDGTVGES